MEDTLRAKRINMSTLRFWNVLILVLMEDTLREDSSTNVQMYTRYVLILVVMEDTLRDLSDEYGYCVNGFCLNPCFNGRYS